MTLYNKILRIIPPTFFGSWFIYKLYKSATEDFIFDGIIFFFIGVVGLMFFVWTIRLDYQEYKQSKTIISYLPTKIGFVFILMISGLHVYQKKIINSPTLIRAFYDGGYNGISIDLKENGDWIIANGSGLGQSYFYGSYSIIDSIITLDEIDFDEVLNSDKLVIRTMTTVFKQHATEVEDTIHTDYLIQIGKNGKELNTDVRFRVLVDNRK